MQDFVPVGQENGNPSGIGGYRDYVPATTTVVAPVVQKPDELDIDMPKALGEATAPVEALGEIELPVVKSKHSK